MIVGTGVDIVKIARFCPSPGKGFMERVFSVAERAHIASRGASAPQTMAGIFAAKEAVVKALGIGFAGFAPREVEICKTHMGQPYVKLHKGVLSVLRNRWGEPPGRYYKLSVSISHTQEDAVAFAVLERL